MEDTRQVIRVDAEGRPGMHGSSTEDYIPYPLEARLGSNGLHGQSATSPTPGGRAQDVQVRLFYDENVPGAVRIAGEGAWAGKLFSATKGQVVHFDLRGGDGGRGGRGQNGQLGGRGMPGDDATKYQDGQEGGQGGRGGDAGFGTSGADAGAGGNITISVHEDDLDLLVGISWNIRGGQGGDSGQHGIAGDGGFGGQGGSAIRWTETSDDTTYTRSRPAGATGNPGRPGNRPSTLLSGGRHGPNGSAQIRVLQRDGTERYYPRAYELEVTGFDVVDENRDGVNEPGEHLIVQNIRVKNKGLMPSPNNKRPIALLIRDMPWFTPVTSEPVFLPASIAPGQEVTIPGSVRAFIQNERPGRAPGIKLHRKDNTALTACFYQRLQHYLPSFCGNRSCLISYPLELAAPRYLETVQKGDRVRIEWTVKNVSCKVQGCGTRYAATRLTGASEVFELPRVEVRDAALQEVVDLVQEIQPGAELVMEQEFLAKHMAPEYSDTKLQLQLFLASPRCDAQVTKAPARLIMSYSLPVQIVNTYKHNPGSQYLLVVNSRTPSWAIHQIMNFIENDLHLGLDVYNISLTGSLTDGSSGHTVLDNYRGKSIIIYGNAFPYFEKDLKNAWHFIDSQVANSLARAGTNFLFCAVSDEVSLRQWRAQMTYPSGFSEEQVCLVKNVESIVQDNLSRTSDTTVQDVVYAFTPHRSCCDKLRARFHKAVSLDTHAQRAVDEFTETAPLQRFMVVPSEHVGVGDQRMLTAVEGLPKIAYIVCSTLVPENTKAKLPCDHLQYGIISALPFPQLARMFWSSFFALQQRTEKSTVDSKGAVSSRSENAKLQPKLLSFVCLAIESQVTTELTYLLPSNITAKDCPPHATKLNFLLDIPILLGMPVASMPDLAHIRTLGTILGSLLNIGVTEFFSGVIFPSSMKHKLHAHSVTKLERAIHLIAADTETAREVLKSIEEEAAKVKRYIKTHGSIAKLIAARKAALKLDHLKFTDLAAISSMSLAITRAQLEQMRLDDRRLVAAREADERHASEVLARHINADTESSSKDWTSVKHDEQQIIDCAKDMQGLDG